MNWIKIISVFVLIGSVIFFIVRQYKNSIFTIRDWLEILRNFMVILVSLVVIVYLLPYIGFSPSEWIEIIGAVIGVIGAYLLFTVETRLAKKKERLDNAPRVVISNERYDNCWFEFGSDFLEEKGDFKFSDTYTPYSQTFSKLTVPLINAGRTPIFNISIQMDIINVDNNMKKLESLEKSSFVNYELQNDDKIKITEEEERGQNLLNISKDYSLKNHKYDGIPNLMPGEDLMIPLPLTYIKIIQYILSPRANKETEIVKPFLRITINFDDYEFNSKKETFFITYSSEGYNSAFRPNNFNLKRIFLNLIFKSYPEDKFSHLDKNEITL